MPNTEHFYQYSSETNWFISFCAEKYLRDLHSLPNISYFWALTWKTSSGSGLKPNVLTPLKSMPFSEAPNLFTPQKELYDNLSFYVKDINLIIIPLKFLLLMTLTPTASGFSHSLVVSAKAVTITNDNIQQLFNIFTSKYILVKYIKRPNIKNIFLIF